MPVHNTNRSWLVIQGNIQRWVRHFNKTLMSEMPKRFARQTARLLCYRFHQPFFAPPHKLVLFLRHLFSRFFQWGTLGTGAHWGRGCLEKNPRANVSETWLVSNRCTLWTGVALKKIL